MIEVEDVKKWLREGDDINAASIIEQCEFSYEYINYFVPIYDDEGEGLEGYDLKIHAPRKILKHLSQHKAETEIIESAIRELSEAETGYFIKGIYWVALISKVESSPSDPEIQKILSDIDLSHIKSAWEKALARIDKDPDGALTSAKTLIEMVCKLILEKLDIKYSENDDINKLYFLTSEALEISTAKNVDKESKRIFGNISSIVGGIAFFRNKLGDAHGQREKNELVIDELSELSVNLAGNICIFLIKVFEKKKKEVERAENKV